MLEKRREAQMKVIRKINNNVALCLDSRGNEVVAFGKGIGFKKPPYELELNQIQRTYWGIDKTYISMIEDIPPEILEISDQIVNYARSRLNYSISSNIVFTLADHITFAIQRQKENIKVRLPIMQDVRYLFEAEMDIGRYALGVIRKKLKVYFDDDEAVYIALHIINAEAAGQSQKFKLDEEIIQEIVEQIETHFQIRVDKEGFSYSRFVSHMHYLLKRGKNRELLKGGDLRMYESMAKEYPDIYACMLHIRKYLEQTVSWEMTEEECLYLMLHINRLCDREEQQKE